jgi:hypothetical protein
MSDGHAQLAAENEALIEALIQQRQSSADAEARHRAELVQLQGYTQKLERENGEFRRLLNACETMTADAEAARRLLASEVAAQHRELEGSRAAGVALEATALELARVRSEAVAREQALADKDRELEQALADKDRELEQLRADVAGLTAAGTRTEEMVDQMGAMGGELLALQYRSGRLDERTALVAHLSMWAQHVAALRRVRRTAAVVLARMLHWKVARAMTAWLQYIASAKAVRELCGVAARRIQHVAVAYAFSRWSSDVSLHRLLRRASARWASRTLLAAFGLWVEMVAQTQLLSVEERAGNVEANLIHLRAELSQAVARAMEAEEANARILQSSDQVRTALQMQLAEEHDRHAARLESLVASTALANDNREERRLMRQCFARWRRRAETSAAAQLSASLAQGAARLEGVRLAQRQRAVGTMRSRTLRCRLHVAFLSWSMNATKQQQQSAQNMFDGEQKRLRSVQVVGKSSVRFNHMFYYFMSVFAGLMSLMS